MWSCWQLRIEKRAGRVFKEWEEGRIYFAPTYKYLTNSDNYVVQISTSKEKQRTPAWYLFYSHCPTIKFYNNLV